MVKVNARGSAPGSVMARWETVAICRIFSRACASLTPVAMTTRK